MEIIDISPAISSSMLSWPTGRPVAAHEIVDDGNAASPRNSEWTLDSHVGAHVDAPLHWLPGGADVSQLPLDPCLGPCEVIAVDQDRPIEPGDFPRAALSVGSRLILRTSNSSMRLGTTRFDASFAALSPESALALAAANVGLVGIDYLSVEAHGGDGRVHLTLLRAGVVLLEGLDLRAVEPGSYMLSALPLKLVRGEAAPVRAVLWR